MSAWGDGGRRGGPVRAAAIAAVLVAAVALSGCVIVEHPDATIGNVLGEGPVATPTDAATDARLAGTVCTPTTATMRTSTPQRTEPRIVRASVDYLSDGRLDDIQPVEGAGLELVPSHVLDGVGGTSAWLTRLSTRTHLDLVDPASVADVGPRPDVTASGFYVVGWVAPFAVIDLSVTCSVDRYISLRVTAPIGDPYWRIVECDQAPASRPLLSTSEDEDARATALLREQCPSVASADGAESTSGSGGTTVASG